MKVLVAEDDPVSRLALIAALKRLGHEVLQARDGEEAWAVFLAQHPRAILSDWMMPRLDGLDLCRRVRAEDSDSTYTYFVLLTVLSDRSSYLEGMDAGADDFVTKPIAMDELGARLRVAGRLLTMHARLHLLEGLLPICAYCKKIRDGENVWHQIEHYISEKTDVMFSHGICPHCQEEFVRPQLEAIRREARP